MDNILTLKRSNTDVVKIHLDKVVRVNVVEKTQIRRIVNDDVDWHISQLCVVCRDERGEYTTCIDQFTSPDAFDEAAQVFGVTSKWGKLDRQSIIKEQEEYRQELEEVAQAKLTGISIPKVTEEKVHFLLRWWRALTNPRY